MAGEIRSPVRYRLGLDLGSTSIGWAVLRLDEDDHPDYLVRLGVRIFSDGRNRKDGASLAVNRRLKRQQRRRRDRFLRRKQRLIAALKEFNLWPTSDSERKTLQDLNPYELRTRALSASLTAYEFGRAIFHLNQRRGFRSSRKTNKSADNDKGQIKSAISTLRVRLQESGSETVGAYLFERWKRGEGTRARRFGYGAKASYDFYVDRSMIAEEFDLIWERQRSLQTIALPDTARASIRDVLLYQRPLKPVRPGRCSLEPTQDRAPLALPSSQRFRILQEVNNLRLRRPGSFEERSLTPEERKQLVDVLYKGRTRNFQQIRSLLKLPDAIFNLESEKRKELKGNLTAAILAKDSIFGKEWHDKPLEEQEAIVIRIMDDTLLDDEVRDSLKADCGLTHDAAELAMSANLPDGYARLSLTAVAKIMPGLESGLTYDKALRAASYEGTDTSLDGSLPRLPYYGIALQRHVSFGSGEPKDTDEKRFGRISNPSVHIALNQLRNLINALIDRYGKPAEVVLELTRDLKLGWNRAREIERDQAAHQQENDDLRETLRQLGQSVNAENLLRLRLFRELERASGIATRCIYTGEQISLSQLFTPEIQIDHLLPFSRTLDDSIANKALCKEKANRLKGNMTPFEAFGHSPPGYTWAEILLRAAELPRRRAWRFGEDAMTRFGDENAFIARQLTDTAYMSRVAREFMTAICPTERVWAATGSLTSMLRNKWGLNQLLSHDNVKNRLDHRHHAIDAAVIGCIDRSIVQRVSTAAAKARSRNEARLVDDIDHPWASFLDGMRNGIDRVVISHRPDHNAQDALHNETSYGSRDDNPCVNRNPASRAVHSYAPLLDLADSKPDSVREKLADKTHGQRIADLIERYAGSKSELRAALEAYGKAHNIRRVRWTETLTVVPIHDRRTQKPYKFLKGDNNYCYEIFALPNGRWDGEVIDTFRANQMEYRSRSADSVRFRKEALNGQPLIMRLVVSDIVAIEIENRRLLYRVQQLTKGKIMLAHHTAAGDPTRDKRLIPGIEPVKQVAPSKLRDLKARRVFVDILGRVKDPGWQHAWSDSGTGGG